MAVRRRKHLSDDAGDGKKNNRKKDRSAKAKSSSGVVVILFIMVIVVWAIAATAYFGVINYKALLGLGENEIKQRAVKEDSKTVESQDTDEAQSIVSPSDNVKKADDKKAANKDGDTIVKSTNTKASKTSQKDSKEKTKKPSKGNDKEGKSPLDSKFDDPILKELANGEALLKKKKGNEAYKLFNQLLQSNPNSPRAMFGKARALLRQSDEQRSNRLLQEGIDALGMVDQQPHCPLILSKEANLLKIDKQLFFGRMRDALKTASGIYKKMPKDVQVLNKMGVCYLYLGKNPAAKSVYKQALAINPNDGFAQVHYGFIVKSEGDWVEGSKYLRLGIESMEEGTQEGKFYMHLGDALHRINKTAEANEIYERGAAKGLFRSKYQRSLYNVDRLQSHPFWTAKEAKVTSYVQTLEKNWKVIRDEALSIMDKDKGLFLSEEESLKNTGDWKQFTLFARGNQLKDCKRLPKTCAMIEKMPNAVGCKRGQIKFSVMAPGTHVWAHTGPTNCRLRMHLGLVVPKTGEGAKLRCGDTYKTWEEGKVLIFDDSFEHEVWQYAESYRLILIIDVWHPDLTEKEKKTLSPI